MRRCAEHLVGGGDDLGVELVAALRLDQFGDLAHRIDRAAFKIALSQRAEAILTGGCDKGVAGRRCLKKQVRSDRLEPLGVREARKQDLPQQLGLDLVVEIGIDLARGID